METPTRTVLLFAVLLLGGSSTAQPGPGEVLWQFDTGG